MPINSMYTDYPPQPNNPSDEERYFLARNALAQKNRPEDFMYVKDLMSPPADIASIAKPGEFKGHSIGIIGGGLAGMAAAFELRKLGFNITIFDALEDRIGGRVYTYYFDEAKTLYGELGAMRIPVNHETTWHYINLFGLKTRTFIQSNPNGIIYLRGIHARNVAKNIMDTIYPKYDLYDWEKKLTPDQLINYGYDNHLFAARPDQRAEILQVKSQYNPFALFWDGMSSRQMLQRANLSQDAINLVSYLAPIAGNFLYNSYIDYIQEDYPPDFSYLYEIIGGSVNLPLAFYRTFMDIQLASEYSKVPKECLGNITWKGGNWVSGIYKTGNTDKIKIEFQNKKSARPQFEDFDFVVCSIPFSTLRMVEINPLFSKGKMQAIKEATYVTAQKSLLLCSNRFWEQAGVIGGHSYTDVPLTTVWYPSDHAQLIPGRYTSDLPKTKGVLLNYNFNQDAIRVFAINEHLHFEENKRELERLHNLPEGYLNNIVIKQKSINWNDEKWFGGSFCFFTPEQKRVFSYDMTVPEYDNRVFFAGEHISAKHRWIQGALQSGMVAARDLALACKYYRRNR